jgi:SNF2 family DNA or RNA helicase
MKSIDGCYVESSVQALDDVNLEASSEWMEKIRRQNSQEAMEHVPPSPALQGELRPYQQVGLNWLRFLEKRGFCGILADEMGLGKTLQTLAWIQLSRVDLEHQDFPALIVCPTSLVENWKEEAARFTPNLKVILLHGSTRHRRWKMLKDADIVITSYALMRRDVERHLEHTYSIVILDEAQHIKNHTTQNALAAKKLKAGHRLVLTGTPMENSVSDLWSIMDFLMPGYLGGHKEFHEHYEVPILAGGELGEYAQSKLRRKLHPFLLRRLKKDVAKDLPPKIERIAPCKLTQDQHKVYTQLLQESKQRIQEMVERDGFNKSRMEILSTLLRLRQTCCHIDLLRLEGLQSKYPSAKMDLFFELLDEALDSKHRVLVFSQFTSMLTILRKEMDQRNLEYCYLDGTTKDRQDVVRRFNRNQSIPVFLMSLKAGGTGLNLTGADMVIHFDPWWNPAVEAQATDRAHRIGQKRTVYSVKLVTKGTIEEKVVEMQRRKQDLIDAALTTDEQVIQKLSWEDVRELLSL